MSYRIGYDLNWYLWAVEITSCLFDINLNAIVLLTNKAAAALFEQFLGLIARALWHAVVRQKRVNMFLAEPES